MAHAIWIEERISQIKELVILGCKFEQIAKIIKNSGLMIIRDNEDVTEEWVFNQCVEIQAKRMRGEDEPDVSDEGFDPYSNCYTDDC